MKVTDKYILFYGKDPFSNFSDHRVVYDGRLFNNSEQVFQWTKAMFFHDTQTAHQIWTCQTAGQAKAYGKRVNGFDKQSWDNINRDFMKHILKKKVEQNPEIKELLLTLGKDHKFVEASPTDRLWGVGYGISDAEMNQGTWGENRLGKCWDDIYDYFNGSHKTLF